MKYVIRLFALPFWIGILTINCVVVIIKRSYLFMKHGGEFINYVKGDRVTMQMIYEELKSKK